MQQISKEYQNTVCLRLDIANFFNSLDISILLNYLSKYVQPSIQQQLRYDAHTIEQLRFFFDYMRVGFTGIPQMDNGIISDYIGYLYLSFGDMFLSEVLDECISQDEITGYKTYRYVDDMYLFLRFQPNLFDEQRDSLITKISGKIADAFDQKLSLKYNQKTGYFRLGRERERHELITTLKRVSPDEPLPDESLTPQERADNVIKELNLLKEAELSTTFSYSNNGIEIAIETLKEVFDDPVDTILNSQKYLDKLREIFDPFNFDMIRIHPSSMLAIICRAKLSDVVGRFEEYLLEKDQLTNIEIDLILRFLSFEEFKNQKLLNLLKRDPRMATIINVFQSPKAIPQKTGYYSITSGRIKKLSQLEFVIHQIRLRVMAEREFKYSLALNHLLNEIHAISYELHRKMDSNMTKRIKDYRGNDVVDFLQMNNVPQSNVVQIRNLFNRRNNNTPSHPGSTDHPAFDVNESDYWLYHNQVGECLSRLL